MTILATIPDEPKLQRAYGRIKVVTKRRPNGTTGLDVLGQQGSSKAVFPKPTHANLEAVLVNTAGGVTGGDRFDVSVHAASGTGVSITTQAAERIYGAATQQAGQIRTNLFIEDNAELCWLPQETILFNQCRLKRQLSVEVSATGRFLMVEPLVFGRAASGESLKSCSFLDCVSIIEQGQPVYLDQVHLTGAVARTLDRPAVGAGSGAMANVVLIDRNCEDILPAVRALLPEMGGASVLNDRTLVLRLLCADSFALRQALLPILALLTHNAVPKNWRL